MFKIQNSKSGKIVRDAITCRPRLFETEEQARYLADCLERNSTDRATAWNSIRTTKYTVINHQTVDHKSV